MAATKREWYIVNDDYFVYARDETQTGETFTVGTVGIDEDFNITSVKIKASRDVAPETLYLAIKAVDGEYKPTGEDLSTGSVDPSGWAEVPEWHEISMSTHKLLASTQYALVAKSPGSTDTNRIKWQADSSSPAYIGGATVSSNDGGESWSVHATWDMMFEIWGEPSAVSETVEPATFEVALTQETPTILFPLQTMRPDTFEIALTQPAPTISTRFIDIPPLMEKDLIDPYSGGAWLWLVSIAIPGQVTRRIARNTENVPYNGYDFEKSNLQIGEQIFSGDGSIPRVTLRVFQDANHIIEDMINETEGALGAHVQLIRVNEKFLNVPVSALEADYDSLASESDTEWVTFTLGMPNPLTQRYPLEIYNSSTCPLATPTLFKGARCQYTGQDSTCTGTYEDCYLKGNAIHFGAELGLDPNVVRI